MLKWKVNSRANFSPLFIELSQTSEFAAFAIAIQPQPRPVRDNGESFAFPITIEQDEDEFWLASCPSLPGCHSQAHSKPEAIVNIKEAIRGYLASMHAHGETIPDQEWVIVEVAI